VGTNPTFGNPTASQGSTFYGRASLYRYDGAKWSRCDSSGVAGQLAPDPACAGVASLIDWKRPDGTRGSTQLVAADRVPYERDGNPGNDDELEVVAVGSRYQDGDDQFQLPVLVRLKNGRWQIDRGLHDLLEQYTTTSSAITLVDVAFTAPDDGWVLGRRDSLPTLLFHWDGTSWSLCAVNGGGCADGVPGNKELGAVLGLEAAGDRVYTYGWRVRDNGGGSVTPGSADDQLTMPMVIYRDRRAGVWTDGSQPGEKGGGHDPGNPRSSAPAPDEQGKVTALSVEQRPDGSYDGWAVGTFYDYAFPPTGTLAGTGADQHEPDSTIGAGLEPAAVTMRLEEHDGTGSWGYFDDPGALDDFMTPTLQRNDNRRPQTKPRLMAIGPDGRALIAQRRTGVLFGFDSERGRFDVVPGLRPAFNGGPGGGGLHGTVQAIAPDGRGGFWVAVKNRDEGIAPGGGAAAGGQVYFFHYTDRPHQPVFSEVAQPLGGAPERWTSLAGAADGSVWAGTDAGRLARYDRMTGWQVLAVPGWDPGRVVTKRSEVSAVAVNDDGVGVAVGPGGRIADLSGDTARLDRAAGVRCGAAPVEPCGTGYALRAAAMAPDGSAIAAGDALTVLWRPAGGEFRRVERPRGSAGNRITGASFPAPDRAYLTSDAGYVYAGTVSDGVWTWRRENRAPDGRVIGMDAAGNEVPLRAVAIDSDGHGYAVGDRGVLIERTAAGWKRLEGPGTDDLWSVTVGADGRGAVVGGEGGVVWTRVGDGFEVARPADYSRRGVLQEFESEDFARAATGPLTGGVVGVALVPGVEDGQVEAWAASEARGDGTNRLFHYASDAEEPLLDPGDRVQPLPDSPAPGAGEIAFAALGNTDCDLRGLCYARRGTLTRHEVLGDRIVDELRARAELPGGPAFTLFTGDATFTAGLPASSTSRSDRIGSTGTNFVLPVPKTDPYGDPEMARAPVMQRQWNRMIADPLERAGLAVFGTAGPGDLSRPYYRCDTSGGGQVGGCGAVGEEAKTGDNLSWRDAMAVRTAPWGAGSPAPSGDGGLSFVPVTDAGDDSFEVSEQRADPDGPGPLREMKAGGGARTHYAVDVLRGGERVARIVVVDTSLRSVQASDPIQQPIERDGQMAWLERMICREGERTAAGAGCSLGRDDQTIVLTSTPTYSYGATSPAEVDTGDGIRLESLLMEHDVSVVLTGRLGWNARYWASAPGVHVPCPGEPYRDTPPAPGSRLCDNEQAGAATDEATARADEVAGMLGGLDAQPPDELPAPVASLTGQATGDGAAALPFVIAGGGGGPLGTSAAEESQQRAGDGYWNGYTIVRVEPGRGVVVDQRPVFDWIHLAAPTHVLRPGQKMTLKGVGREPVGYGAKVLTRFDELSTQAITHRYDLVVADPEKPYLPLEDANGDYVPVPPQVATADRTTGALRTGKGRSERTYAVAILSVGDEAATWPIAFEPRRSFTPSRARVVLPPLPRVARAPAAQAPIRVSDAPPPPPPPPPATPGSPFSAQTLQPPQPPQLPSLPAANAPPAPAPPQLQAPPAPPAPPPPPSVPPQQQPMPLTLNAKLQAISLVPSVNPPAPPPVNPAPPAGGAARKEAKQRQAAAAKSEEGDSKASEGTGDLAQDRPAPKTMTRRERDRPAPSISALSYRAQPSAWSLGALYGGGLGLAAAALALGFSILRPRPRRRPPEVPAPAWARMRRPYR
jgi:hypothetical protein